MKVEDLLIKLYQDWRGESPSGIEPLPISGSARQYFRIKGNPGNVIGCFNDNKKENKTFLTYSKHFYERKLPVPEVFISDPENQIYLQQDLGDQTLFAVLPKKSSTAAFPAEIEQLYEEALSQLIRFQFDGHSGLNYSVAYPRKAFDTQSMTWDLNYFKHYFIKLAGIAFHEQELEDDFQTLIDFLSEADTSYFLYRDFQSRNIMVHNKQLYFIDYQGGRMGALAYDPASLLFDAKANIPVETRHKLLNFYISKLKERAPQEAAVFKKYFYGFALIRIMQAFGAFGYRGFFERKLHFLQSIPYAIKNLKWILDNDLLPTELPALTRVFQKIVNSPNLKEFDYQPSDKLTVLINSFSYKRNIPLDNSGNGGGFVFDCRFLPNPGRLQEYKYLTGKDSKVSSYLETFPECARFIENTSAILSAALDNYQSRKFHHLMVCFGCTGGQHRSVYFAGQTFALLKQKFPDIQFKLRHIEMELNPVNKKGL